MTRENAVPQLTLDNYQGELKVHVPGVCSIEGIRTVIIWKHPQECDWTVSRSNAMRKNIGSSGDLEYSATAGPFVITIRYRQITPDRLIFSTTLINSGRVAICVARMNGLDGRLVSSGLNLKAMSDQGLGSRTFRFGDSCAAPAVRVRTAWEAMHTHWQRMSDPCGELSGYGSALDAGFLYADGSAHGLLVGILGPGTAFGEIGLSLEKTGNGQHVWIGHQLDGVVIETGMTRVLDDYLLISGLENKAWPAWAAECAVSFGVNTSPSPVGISGYCSWYDKLSSITADDIDEAIREYSAWPCENRRRFVQVDDGFQKMPGDWRPNQKFAHTWGALPARISTSGAVPGLWLAPTAIHSRHPLVKEHPDWIQRSVDGKPSVAFSNWGWCCDEQWYWGVQGDPTWFLEPDHPGVRAFIQSMVADVIAQGWKYLKIDFAYVLSNNRVAYDKGKTSFQTLRNLFALLRQAASHEITLCACVGVPARYALGYSDTARISGDMGSTWESVVTNLPDILLRSCTNGAWWALDPDVFYMRGIRNALKPEERTLVTATIGLLDGVFMTSDIPSQWTAAEASLVRLFWDNVAGSPSQIYHEKNSAGLPTFICTRREQVWLGVYNWHDYATDVRVELPGAWLPRGRKTQAQSIIPGCAHTLCGETFTVNDQPSHSIRVFVLN